jgi:phosphatidylinositol alpha-1,6-mannosyltransferase
MRVLWITGNFFPLTGGLETYVDRLVSVLRSHAEVALLTDGTQERPSHPGIDHFSAPHIARPSTSQQFDRSAAAIAAIAKDYVPDVIHLASAGMGVFRRFLPSESFVVATVHGNDLTAPWQKTPGKQTIPSIVEGLNACDRIIAVSGHTAALVRGAGIHTPLTVMTSGCDIDFFRPLPEGVVRTREAYGVPRNVPVILTVGRLVARKGHETLLDAIQRLAVQVHWWVVGAGPQSEHLRDIVARRNMQQCVSFLGRVSQAALLALYNACDLFVLTPEERRREHSLDSEGFGLVFHEAMACGKAVIGSDVSGCKEAIINDATGLLVPPRDSVRLSEAISHLLARREEASAMGARGFAFVQASGGWDRTARQVYEVYEELLYGAFETAAPDDWKIPL